VLLLSIAGCLHVMRYTWPAFSTGNNSIEWISYPTLASILSCYYLSIVLVFVSKMTNGWMSTTLLNMRCWEAI